MISLNMNTKTFIVLILFLSVMTSWSYSQTRNISGYVSDSLTGERLIGVNIFAPLSNIGAITNQFGFYSLKIPEDSKEIHISYVGYKVKSISIFTSEDIFLNINLERGISLDVVVITSNAREFQKANETGISAIPMESLYKLPEFVGDNDIIHALQLMPGVQGGSEGKASLYIRGGSPDQNLMLIDDVPLYNVNHYGGFLSTFNSDAIKDFKLYKGGFPARYGSRLSSVLDIRLKDGDLNKYNFSGSVGLLSSKIMIDGPIKKQSSSFLLSIRKNTFPIFKTLFGVNLAYRFYDINTKLNFRINEKNRLLFSFYSGDDNVLMRNKTSDSNLTNKTKNNTAWGNVSGSLRLNTLLRSNVFVNSIIGYTSYHYNIGFNNSYSNDTLTESESSRFNSKVNDIFIKVSPEIFISPKYKIRFGAELQKHRFTPGSTSYTQENSSLGSNNYSYNNQEVNSIENNIYIENDADIFNWLGCNIGVHYSGYYVQKESYFSLEPRLLANIRITPELSIKPAYSEMQQYVHLLTYSGVGMPSDFWMPSTALVSPENSKQVSVGIEYYFNKKYKFSIESYQKMMDNLITFNLGESFFANSEAWENKILTGGKGINRGIEILCKKEGGKTNGWIGITVSKSERSFLEIMDGKLFPFKYDRKYEIEMVLIHNFTDNISVSGVWKYGSGYPVTLPMGKYDSYGNVVYIYGDVNSFRMRDYHRLDLGAKFTKAKKLGERTWNISILNVYNRRNPYYYFFQYEQIQLPPGPVGGFKNGNLKLYQQSLISFFPSLSFSFKLNH